MMPDFETPAAHSVFTSSADGVRAVHQAIDLLGVHWNDLPDRPVAPASTVPADVRAWARAFDLERGAPLDALVPAVMDGLRRWTVHPAHPRYFGLFNPTPTWPGITADLIAAVMNPQLAGYSHAPAAVELEQACVRLLADRLGLPAEAGGHLTSGGAEANHTAVLTALTAAFPAYATAGLRALDGPPVFYASADSHLAWIKIAHATGLGRDALRLVPADAAGRLHVAALEDAITHDVAAGRRPFLVIATAGTTAAGAIDPLSQVADVARDHGLRLHVDAAWAGAACLSDRYRPTLAGIERADTITLDAHKWLSVPMGAGIFFTRRRAELPATFGVSTSYMPGATDDAPDPYTATLQWSRRFAGLKLFLSLATFGVAGYAAEIERNVALGERLRAGLRAAGWRVVNDTPLPIVCVTHPAADAHADDAAWAWHAEVAARVVESGEAWVSPARVAGRPAVRACLTSYRTEAADVDALVALLDRALLHPRSARGAAYGHTTPR